MRDMCDGHSGKMSAHARLFGAMTSPGDENDKNMAQRVHVTLTSAELRAKNSLLLQR